MSSKPASHYGQKQATSSPYSDPLCVNNEIKKFRLHRQKIKQMRPQCTYDRLVMAVWTLAAKPKPKNFRSPPLPYTLQQTTVLQAELHTPID